MKKELPVTAMSFPMPTYIVATYNEEGSVDAMNLGLGGVCSLKPPCLQISLNTGRRTRENILRTGAFTVSIGGEALMKVSDYFGLVSGAEEDKLSKTGITYVKSQHVNAPILEQYPLSIACALRDTLEIGPHLMAIGEIKGIVADAEILDERGNISVEKLAPIGLDPVGHHYVAFDRIVGKAYQEGTAYLE